MQWCTAWLSYLVWNGRPGVYLRHWEKDCRIGRQDIAESSNSSVIAADVMSGMHTGRTKPRYAFVGCQS